MLFWVVAVLAVLLVLALVGLLYSWCAAGYDSLERLVALLSLLTLAPELL